MTGERGGDSDPRVIEAAEWFARMRAPDAEALRAEFEAWRTDLLNAAAYDEIAGVWAATEVGHWAPVVAEHRRRAKREEARRAAYWRPGAAASLAAGFLLAGALSFFWILPFGDAAPPKIEIASEVGEIRTDKLPDGSTVTLDTNTRMTLVFSEEERRIVLTNGRARFDVVHDETRAFVVEAAGRTITDRGTLFDVDVASGGLVVVLLRGSVDVALHGSGSQNAKVRMTPGQVLHAATPTAKPAIVVSGEAPQWPEGRMSYDRVPLAGILADSARYSSRPIALGDPALGALRVTGVFSVRDPDALADKLAAALGLRAVHSGAEIVLRR